jgi:uncharacterized protein
MATLEKLITQAMEQSGPAISFGWQGGEPTLMGLQFFETAVGFQSRFSRSKQVDNSLQTNGLKLGPKWAEFLARYNFLVGLSIDGPAHIHDRYRKKAGGRPTHSIVEKKAKLLLEGGVQTNALCCVTDYSSRRPETLYNYFKSINLPWMQFIPIQDSENPCNVDEEAYGDFLVSIFDLWRNDFKDGLPTTSIRFIETLFYAYTGQKAADCTMQNQCGTYIVVEHNGDIYSCDFYVEPAWKLGNLATDSLREALNSDKQYEFGNVKQVLPKKCKACPWLKYCFGGCPKDRLTTKDFSKNKLCRSYIQFFEHADDFLTQLAKKWKQNNPQ